MRSSRSRASGTPPLRLLRATKNRFGSTEEVGVFEMGEPGPGEVADPGRAFLVEHDAPGAGQRRRTDARGKPPDPGRGPGARLAEPVRDAGPASERRSTPNRLALLVAVLGRRAGIGLGSHDVYANLAGGLTVGEPGLDLPLALALASSLRETPVSPGTVAIGEVGLLGELRGVTGLERRLAEAERLGFRRAVVPQVAARAPRRAIGHP